MPDPSQRNLGSVQDFLHGGTQLNCCWVVVPRGSHLQYVGDTESQATPAGDKSSANDGDLSAAENVR